MAPNLARRSPAAARAATAFFNCGRRRPPRASLSRVSVTPTSAACHGRGVSHVQLTPSISARPRSDASIARRAPFRGELTNTRFRESVRAASAPECERVKRAGDYRFDARRYSDRVRISIGLSTTPTLLVRSTGANATSGPPVATAIGSLRVERAIRPPRTQKENVTHAGFRTVNARASHRQSARPRLTGRRCARCRTRRAREPRS